MSGKLNRELGSELDSGNRGKGVSEQECRQQGIITIIDDTKDFLVVDKPLGISVQDAEGAPGVISLLKKQTGYVTLFPVHRIDRVTSGLLIVAKNTEANRSLSMSFERREPKKIYLAITRTKEGAKPKKKQGTIVGDMLPARNGSWMLARTTKRPARTKFFSASMGNRYRLCLVKPKTGKTHQIRVALKSIAIPIVGDERYGGFASDRTYLHAYMIHFSCLNKAYSYCCDPLFGELFSGEAFQSALDSFGDIDNITWSS